MSRRTNSARSARSGNTVDMEVANLMNLKNKNDFTNSLLVLRQRYNDEDLVNKIQEVFVQRHASIVKSAKKFAIAVKSKYAQQNVPFHALLMKARAHAKKHHLSEAEFSEFQRIYEQELAGSGSPEVMVPVTNLMKVLGNINSGTDNYFNVDEADYKNLQEILKCHDATKVLHSQVILQALQYGGFDTEATNGTYNRDFMDSTDYVHPVIAALFLPKIKYVEQQFLFSNISGIVKSRYNRAPITTLPDYELFYNLVTDPNDVVCDTRTPVGDLLARCNLQNNLWKSVLHLRNGKYYAPALREFLAAVDVCRLNKHDNPELIYGRHDGTIIKRLFSAFSFRPTTVSTIPTPSLFMYNPYSQVLRPTVTSIPMINVRLIASSPSRLKDALTQQQKFFEGNILTDRLTKVMYSREVLVFYVDRRFFRYNMAQTPFSVLRLPSSIAGFERINAASIHLGDVDETTGKNTPTTIDTVKIKLSKETSTPEYELVSVVVADTRDAKILNDKDPNGTQFVVGSYTVFPRNGMGGGALVYCPAAVTIGGLPMCTYDEFNDKRNSKDEMLADIESKGMIFIYQNKDDNANTPAAFMYF